MQEDIESYKDYWQYVQRQALIEIEEVEEWMEREDEDMDRWEIIQSSVDYAVDNASILDYDQRTVIFHAEHGFEGAGYDQYIQYRDFDSGREMVQALAQAGFYNDVREAIERVFEYRDDLGEAIALVDPEVRMHEMIVEYDYETTEWRDGEREEVTYTFTLENLGENEWKVFYPFDEAFEVISPMVHFEQSDDVIPERSVGLWLDNICAKRLRETGGE